MRNFTFLLSATLAATVAIAAPAGITPNHTVVTANSSAKTATGIKFNSNSKVVSASSKLLNNKSNKAKIASRALTDAVVDEKPEGTETIWSRCSTSFSFSWGDVYEDDDKGLAVRMIDTGDGKVWMNNPISAYPLLSYIYANKTDEGLSIPGGQLVLDYADEYDEIKLYVMPVEFVADDEGYLTPVAKPDGEYKLINENGVWKSADKNLCLGLCGWDEEYEEYAWNGFGDLSIVYEPLTETGIEVPANLETAKWSYITPTGEGYFVNCGIEGSTIYIQGIHPVVPDAWIKLEINGDKAVMESGQFLGEDYESYHIAYAVVGTVEEVWDDDWEDYVDLFTTSKSIEFDYDAENKTLTTDKAIGFAPVADGTLMTSYIANPLFTGQLHKAGVPPTNPIITNIRPSSEYGSIDFIIPCIDKEGLLLDSNRLYYNMFVDGSLFEFYDDEYLDIPESPMINVPYAYHDFDIFVVTIYHTVQFYFTGYENLGIQSVYMEEDENGVVTENRSDLVYFGQDGISSVATDSKIIKSVEYFDLSGRMVANPKNGLYVARITYSDGTVSNQKIHR